MEGLVNEFRASPAERLLALRGLAAAAGALPRVQESNNHIHTIYSFSPYAPAAAALRARRAGLSVAGSVDHDSLAGAAEMREACAVLGMGSVTGFEIRVFLHDKEARRRGGPAAPFQGRKINNPDSAGIVYMTVQGVPAQAAAQAAAFLAPIREARFARTRLMAAQANRILAAAGLPVFDFEADLVGRSKFAEGGAITERHLLAAMADRLIQGLGRGPALAAGLESRLGLSLSPKLRDTIIGEPNPHLLYDLLGLLKAELLPSFFVQPEAECVDARDAVAFARSIGAIPAYAYLGDVGESPTGDKKAEKFEDDFLPELFAELRRIGFLAVTYMPPRNSPAQLARVRELCRGFGFMEISGVDINQSRQSFNCPELRRPEFSHLNDSTWAMVAHEALASVDPALGLFSPASPYAASSLEARIAVYARAGLELGAAGGKGGEAGAAGQCGGIPAETVEIARALREGRYER